jgi:hypothetical protein
LTSGGAIVSQLQGFDIVKPGTNVNFTFKYLAPQLQVVRYIKVKTSEKIRTTSISSDPLAPNISTVEDIPYPTHLISYASPYLEGKEITVLPLGVATTTSYQYYPTGNIGYFLVESGFEASVEAHSIFRPDEEGTIEQILKDRKITLLWHTHKYEDNSITTPPYSFEDRFQFTNDIKTSLCKSAFKDNCIIRRLDSTWFSSSPFDDFPKSSSEGGLLSSYLSDNKDSLRKDYYLTNDEKIRYLDFSKAYKTINNEGNLKHQTPGIYSNFAGILVGDKDPKNSTQNPNTSNQFHNIFNVHVLQDLSSYKDSFLKSSCVWSDTGTGVNYLNIAPGVLSPYYVAVKSGSAWVDIKENGIPYQRVKLNSLDGTVYVYDYILRAWENTVLKGEPEKFQDLLEPSKLGNHIISFKLSDIKNICPFSDVPVNQWYTKPITLLKELKIIEGRSDGSFGLNNPVKRAEFLKMAMLAANYPKKDSDFPETNTSISDMKSHWASGYVDAAKTQKIVDGISKAGKLVFEPENVISRAAAAKIAAVAFFGPLKLMKLYQCDFTDVKDNEWYCPYVSTLAEKGIVKGSLSPSVPGKYVFRPGDQMLREEAAEVICRAYSLSPKTKNTALCD